MVAAGFHAPARRVLMSSSGEYPRSAGAQARRARKRRRKLPSEYVQRARTILDPAEHDPTKPENFRLAPGTVPRRGPVFASSADWPHPEQAGQLGVEHPDCIGGRWQRNLLSRQRAVNFMPRL